MIDNKGELLVLISDAITKFRRYPTNFCWMCEQERPLIVTALERDPSTTDGSWRVCGYEGYDPAGAGSWMDIVDGDGPPTAFCPTCKNKVKRKIQKRSAGRES